MRRCQKNELSERRSMPTPQPNSAKTSGEEQVEARRASPADGCDDVWRFDGRGRRRWRDHSHRRLRGSP